MSVALVAVLVRRYGGDPAFRTALGRLDPTSFLLAEGLVALGLVLSAIRWRVLLAAIDVELPFGQSVRLYFVGYFFNLFLPTTVGGDVPARVSGLRRSRSAGVILVERIIRFRLPARGGAGSELRLGSRTWCPRVDRDSDVRGRRGVLLRSRPRAGAPPHAGRHRAARRSARRAAARGRPGAIVLSLGWQFLLALANGALSRGLGGVAPLGSLLALVPVIQAVGMIPVSFGGLGVREMGYEFFFRRSGFDPAGAVALAACFLGITLAVAAVGGILYLVYPFRKRA
jgi:uncharacterized membrane protein YbhN (UPF0104 family)